MKMRELELTWIDQYHFEAVKSLFMILGQFCLSMKSHHKVFMQFCSCKTPAMGHFIQNTRTWTPPFVVVLRSGSTSLCRSGARGWHDVTGMGAEGTRDHWRYPGPWVFQPGSLRPTIFLSCFFELPPYQPTDIQFHFLEDSPFSFAEYIHCRKDG